METTDIRSNPNDQILHAAEKIGKSVIRKKVFEEIHRGKIKIKTVTDIVKKTSLKRMQVLQATNFLSNNKIIKKAEKNGELAYERDDFFFQNKKKILKLAIDKNSRLKFPTKRTPRLSTNEVKISIITKKQYIDVVKITIDDIDSFTYVKGIKLSPEIKMDPIDEDQFQQGLQKILQEKGVFKDWGGETDDLYTNRIIIEGRRVYAAFGLKGKGTSGKLTPKKMGRQGDQIQRLFRSPADVYFIQYWGQITESIVEQMQLLATAKSALGGRKIYFGIIDGQDTLRLIQAYSDCFDLE